MKTNGLEDVLKNCANYLLLPTVWESAFSNCQTSGRLLLHVVVMSCLYLKPRIYIKHANQRKDMKNN